MNAETRGKPLGLRDGTLKRMPHQSEWSDLYEVCLHWRFASEGSITRLITTLGQFGNYTGLVGIT
jgi:hypothetical protein